MRILYLSQYFPPEVGATQTRAYEMARHLVSAGHEVTMVTEVPNHPSGIIPPEYRGKLYERADLEGIDVLRVWVKTTPAKTFTTRMLFYLTYMINATWAGLLLARGRYDLIYATSPPLFVGGAALALSFLRRTPLVFEVRDLWPESAVALGEMTNPRAAALAGKLEEMCYNRARCIVVVTEGIRRRLEERGFGGKVALIPNGANTELFRPDPEAGAALRAKLGLEDKFLVIYAGIHGIAQGLETVLETAQQLLADAQQLREDAQQLQEDARQLREDAHELREDAPQLREDAHELRERSDVHFLLVGEGPKKAALAALRDDLGLTNVTMMPEQPRSEMPAYMSAADVALAPLRRLDLFRGALPSKIFDAWACGCPVILSIDGEARQVLERADAGVFVEPEDSGQMAQAILQLRDDPARLRRYGENGRRFVEANYSRQALAARLEELLSETIQGNGT